LPELPEVETVRAGLAPVLTNATITGVTVLETRSLKRHPGTVQDFESQLIGSRILGVARRGKFLWMPLVREGDATSDSNLRALVGHLGMSGQMLLRTPDFEPDKLTRVILNVQSEVGQPFEFRFVDQRIFGSLAVDLLQPTEDNLAAGWCPEVPDSVLWRKQIPASAAHISRDPLDEHFSVSQVLAKLSKKKTGIKRAILDQGLLSGVGNIYADEALWMAKLHYDTLASDLSRAKTKELISAIQDILRKAVAQGGTSFDEQYKNVNGESGYFSVSLNAYGMTSLPCKRCSTPIKRESWSNRGSHFCPKCQKPLSK
jgi:formamidopyrimidine-DNA glycosylase